MADKKISELTELTTLAAADEFAVVDDDVATTKRVTYDTLATEIRTEAEALTGTTGTFSGALTADSVVVPDAGSIGSETDVDAITIASTGVVTFTQGLALAAAKGINFSAYGAGADIDNNLLDDYEEGTWDAAYAFASGAVTSNSDCAYVKIGKVVVATFEISTSAISSPCGDATIEGLPFTSEDVAGQRSAVAIGLAQSFATPKVLRAFVDSNSDVIDLRKNQTNQGESIVQGSDFQAGVGQNRMVGVAVYLAA